MVIYFTKNNLYCNNLTSTKIIVVHSNNFDKRKITKKYTQVKVLNMMLQTDNESTIVFINFFLLFILN